MSDKPKMIQIPVKRLETPAEPPKMIQYTVTRREMPAEPAPATKPTMVYRPKEEQDNAEPTTPITPDRRPTLKSWRRIKRRA